MSRISASLSVADRIRTAVEPSRGTDQQILFHKGGKRLDAAAARDILIDPTMLANAAVASSDVGTQARARPTRLELGGGGALLLSATDGQPAPGNSRKDGRVLVAG